MPDKDKKNDKSVSAAPAPGLPADSGGNEEHQFAGSDPVAVNEAAKRAEMAVSDAVKEVARTITAMKAEEIGGTD
ncbi:MAG: hypothetical protein GY950_00315 [bacterium]|nr:hypothetical protein [bacterium]